jgi:hypothetical protein
MKRSTVLFAVIFAVSFLIGIQTVEGVDANPLSSNLTIHADGKIEPSTAPIIIQGSTYTLTGELSNSNLHIQCSGITFDGANNTVYGCIFIESDHVTVENTTINSAGLGILANGSHAAILNNIFFHNLADIELQGGYSTVTGNNDTGGAYMAFYVNSDYNNLTKNNLKEIAVFGNHNTIEQNTVGYLSNQKGHDNIYLDNIVNGQVQSSTPKPTSPISGFELAIAFVLAMSIFIAFVSLVYLKRKKGKL